MKADGCKFTFVRPLDLFHSLSPSERFDFSQQTYWFSSPFGVCTPASICVFFFNICICECKHAFQQSPQPWRIPFVLQSYPAGYKWTAAVNLW